MVFTESQRESVTDPFVQKDQKKQMQRVEEIEEIFHARVSPGAVVGCYRKKGQKGCRLLKEAEARPQICRHRIFVDSSV